MANLPNLFVALLHDQMVDKTGRLVTTSVTLIDVHDIARSCRTFGAKALYVVHPAQTMRALVRTIKEHWDGEFGSTYNPNRQDALERLAIVTDLDEAILHIERRTGKLPKLIATSARDGADRVSFDAMRDLIAKGDEPFLLMFGTGWGMSDQLMARANYTLKPINGPTDYNHLSVRGACAIILDRLTGLRD